MKNLSSFCLLPVILDTRTWRVPYILFKLEKIKKDEVVSIGLYTYMLHSIGCTLIPFSLSYFNFKINTAMVFNLNANIGAIGAAIIA